MTCLRLYCAAYYCKWQMLLGEVFNGVDLFCQLCIVDQLSIRIVQYCVWTWECNILSQLNRVERTKFVQTVFFKNNIVTDKPHHMVYSTNKCMFTLNSRLKVCELAAAQSTMLQALQCLQEVIKFFLQATINIIKETTQCNKHLQQYTL